tara:strand:- start:5969 stop:6373 length:405 start_codon:yes stop_codon:yes gene_type:complete
MNTKNTVFAKLFSNKTKLSKKVNLAYRESELDSAFTEFQNERGELDFILKNKLPDVINELKDFISIIDNSESELNRLIELYNDARKYYEDASSELGIDPESIVNYRNLDTDVFKAEEQLQIASQLRSDINNINI